DAAQRAVHLSEQILSESHPERAYARWVLSVMQIRNFALDDAKASALESLRILEISSLPYALERSRALTVLGMIARRTSDSEGSIAYHRQARKVLHDALPKLHPAKVIPALNLAEGVLEQDSI